MPLKENLIHTLPAFVPVPTLPPVLGKHCSLPPFERPFDFIFDPICHGRIAHLLVDGFSKPVIFPHAQSILIPLRNFSF